VAAAADRRVRVYDTTRPPTEMLEGVELRESRQERALIVDLLLD
jgi:hypothetical protein